MKNKKKIFESRYFLLIFQLITVFFISFELWLPIVFCFALLLVFISPYNFKLLISSLITSLFIGYYIIEEPIGIRLVDILISISLISYVLYKILRNNFIIVKTPLDKQIIIFILGVSFSLIGSQLFINGIINLLRHIELFLFFYIMVDIFYKKGKPNVKIFLDYYVYIAAFASIVAILMLYYSGDTRAFGITGSPLSDLIVSALIITISQIYIKTNTMQRLKYSLLTYILLVEIIMTQTRGAWLSLFLAFLFLIILLNFASISSILKKSYIILILLSLAILSSSLIFSNVFIGIIHRVEHLQQLNIGTLHYRFILWEAAINAFLSNLINGIGIGHFPLISHDYSSIGYTTFYLDNIKGLTAHNIILSYLAESGLIGFFCLLFFLVSVFLLGKKIFNSSKSTVDYELSIPLYCILFFVCISSIYAGSWFWSINGVQFMFFLSLSTILYKVNEN